MTIRTGRSPIILKAEILIVYSTNITMRNNGTKKLNKVMNKKGGKDH